MIRDYQDGITITKIGNVSLSPNYKKDGWANVLSGLGNKNLDKTENTYFGDIPLFSDDELSDMFMGEGMANKIISLLPEDATRAWIDIPGDKKGKLQKELKRLGAKQAFKKALAWARLYRGAVIVMVENGAVDLSRPLPKKVKTLKALRVYSAARIDVQMANIVDAPNSPYFDEIEYYPIRFRNGVPQKVHASRCLVFKGDESPDDSTVEFKYKYWGTPFLMKIYDRMKNWGAVEKGIANLMMEFNIGKYTLSNLAQMLSMNDEEQINAIYDRLDIINASKSIINAVLLGEGESYDRDSANIGGVDAIMDRFQISLAAVAKYPVTRLWGTSPAGMNSTGESDMRQYYDDVSSYQETTVETPLQQLVNIVGSYTGVKNTDFEFNSLWQPTEKEQAEIDKIYADTDSIYLNSGVLSPDEVRSMRYPELPDELPIDESTEEEEPPTEEQPGEEETENA